MKLAAGLLAVGLVLTLQRSAASGADLVYAKDGSGVYGYKEPGIGSCRNSSGK